MRRVCDLATVAGMPTTPRRDDLAPMARALNAQIKAQLGTTAAHMVPSGIRSCIATLAALVVVMAEQIDHLTQRG